MDTKEKNSVFSEYRLYLRMLATINGENFHHQLGRQKRRSNMRCAAGVMVLIVASAIVITMSLWHCLENTSNVTVISDTVPVLLTILQMLLTHVSLMAGNRLIQATIGRLQETVDARRVTTLPFFERNQNVCEQSPGRFH